LLSRGLTRASVRAKRYEVDLEEPPVINQVRIFPPLEPVSLSGVFASPPPASCFSVSCLVLLTGNLQSRRILDIVIM
jgi:hypothetical protein